MQIMRRSVGTVHSNTDRLEQIGSPYRSLSQVPYSTLPLCACVFRGRKFPLHVSPSEIPPDVKNLLIISFESSGRVRVRNMVSKFVTLK